MARDRVFVIGIGEVGGRLAGALEAAGHEVVRVTRESGWERAVSSEPGLRLVCVREDALRAMAGHLAGQPPEFLAFVQNGWVRPLLEPFRGCTRGLVWFTAKGDFFHVLRDSAFSGPAARVLAEALASSAIGARAVGEQEFAALEAEKMGFNCVVGLPLVVHRLSLAEYLAAHAEEAEALFHESTRIPAATLRVPPDPGWWPAFLAAAEPIGWVRASAAKALELRNGAIVRLARRLGAEAPVNARLLAQAGQAAAGE